MTHYAKEQFKLGDAGARFNQINNTWFPRVGGAVNFKVSFPDADWKKAVEYAKSDKENGNYKDYE